MLKVPKLNNYDINVLVSLGNNSYDIINRNHIKSIIIKKILLLNKPLFYLINMFNSSTDILKEAYAETITMMMRDSDYFIERDTILQIVSFTSVDTLFYYGTESLSDDFSKISLDEFWSRTYELENKVELENKRNQGKIRKKLKGKVKKND